MKTRITFILALFVTTTAILMSAVAASERGGTSIDQALLIALSIAVCAGSHVIPAISKRKLPWLIWVLCLVGTVYSHLTFLSYASQRAVNEHSRNSLQRVGIEREISATREALAAINARPVTEVAAKLALVKGWKIRKALEAELSEAKHAESLRDELIKLSSNASVAELTGAVDLVTARVAQVTKSNENMIDLAIGLGFSILLELFGAFLWYEALHREEDNQSYFPAKESSFIDLEEAIASGTIRPTVKEIRAYMGCSQAKAMELHRALRSRVE